MSSAIVTDSHDLPPTDPPLAHAETPKSDCDWSRPRIRWTTDLRRFVSSPHCRDLFFMAIGAPLLGIPSAIWLFSHDKKEIGAALIVASLSVAAWAFQTANVRFGAADIFASEILTLCRIARIVDFVKHMVDSYRDGKPISVGKSTQDYVVIFHNNSKDLEILDGNAVNWVTEFYVYFKAMLDTMSRLPDSPNGKLLSADEMAAYKELLLSVIYMTFLTFESGRHALMQLVDDKCAREEAVLTALLNEIPAYLLLYEVFRLKRCDIRWHRINGRLPQYEILTKQIACVLERPATSELASCRIRDLAVEVGLDWHQPVSA
jgi:hypothetical protein